MMNANALIVLLLSLGNAFAQAELQLPVAVTGSLTRRAITPGVKQLAKDLLQNATIPGLTLGVVHTDGFVELEPFGKKTEDGDSMTVETLFNIASCSKIFLATSVGILMDDFQNGRNVTPLPNGVSQFHWYTKVKDILPGDWQLMDEWATEKATFRDILSHQSGIPRHELSYTPEDTALDIVRRLRHLRPAFELRQRWHYNNMMYMLGAHVVEKYSGMSYPEFAKARIFGPLGMSSTTFSEKDASSHGLLTQSWTKFGRRIPYWMPDETLSLNAGPGGVISSVVDMTKWLGVLLNGGRELATNKTIIPKNTYELATSAQGIVMPKPQFPEFSVYGYGMGIGALSYQGHELLTHGGAIPGFSAEWFVLPTDGIAIVTLANADEKHTQEMAVVYRIIEDYLGLDHKASVRYASEPPRNSSSLTSLVPSFRTHSHKQETTIAAQGDALPLQGYAGTYKNPGYPTVTLCDPRTSVDVPECKSVFDEFTLLEDVHASNDTLYCAFRNTWISHARSKRVRGNLFDLTATYIFPNGYGEDKTPFETMETGQTGVEALFVVENGAVRGLAITGFVGEVTESQRIGGTPEETAEIWFEKV